MQKEYINAKEYFNIGIYHFNNSEWDLAEYNFNKSLELIPNRITTILNLVATYIKLEKYSEGEFLAKKALEIDKNNPVAYFNIGIIEHELGNYLQALNFYDKALSLKPDYYEVFCQKGVTLHHLKLFKEEILLYIKALRINPKYEIALINLGTALHDRKKIKLALYFYDKAIYYNRNNSEALFNKSISLLLIGDYKNGFPLYEFRRNYSKLIKEAGIRSFNKPMWHGGQSLKSKKILLYGEQGLGDYIQFSRYIFLVVKLGAFVILEVPQELYKIMITIRGVYFFLLKGSILPDYDYHCSLMSLPYIFKTNKNNIPNDIPYLNADLDKISIWQNKLGIKRKKRVGIVWSSMSTFSEDYKRSISLEIFIKGLPLDKFDFICLQNKIKESDLITFKKYDQIKFFGEDLIDLSETAALIENLDLIVTTCTSIPHLSGALGKETWILLSYVPDWRWQLGKSHSLWYKNMRLYRQPRLGDWDSVLKRVNMDLENIYINN